VRPGLIPLQNKKRLVVGGAAGPTAMFRIHRQKDRVRLPQTGVEPPTYFFESLGYMVPDRHMDPYFAEFVPLARTPDPKAHMHPGFEFLYVLDGELELRHGDKECVLDAGDSAYFDSGTPHSYQCAGKTPTRVIIVTMHQAPAAIPMRAVNAAAAVRIAPAAVKLADLDEKPAGAL